MRINISAIKEKYNKADAFLYKWNDNKLLLIAVALFFFFYFYLLNILYPYVNDEWRYSLTAANTTQHICNFQDIYNFQIEHYMEWGGRLPAHTLLQTLLLLGKEWSNLLNAGVYILFILVIYSIATMNLKQKVNVLLFIAINLCIWFLVPSLDQDLIWLTGSCNYLWQMTISASFLLFICKYLFTPDASKGGIWKLLLFFFWGIFAGWTLEIVAVQSITLLIFLFVFCKKEKIKIPVCIIAGFIGLVIGAILLLAAPGNFARMDSATEGSDSPFYIQLLRNIAGIFSGFSDYMLLPTFAYVLLVVIHKNKTAGISKKLLLSGLFFASAYIGILAMMVSPTFPTRAWFCPIIFIIIACTLLFSELDLSIKSTRQILSVIFIFAILIFGRQSYLATRDTYEISKAFKQREQTLIEQKEMGLETITIEALPDQRFGFFSLRTQSSDSTAWQNVYYSLYYDVKSVVVKPKKEENIK